MNRAWKAALATYAAIAIITFGYAAAWHQRWETENHCTDSGDTCLSGLAWAAGIMAAPLWPLYWSWEAFS